MKKGRIHIVIPDTQVKPDVPTDHLGWIGQYVYEQFRGQNAAIIHLGDHWDMPSLSSYDKGKKAMEGRRVLDDVKSANKAMALLTEPIKGFTERYFLLGNHENRITRGAELDPQMDGILTLDALNAKDLGWRVVPFLKPLHLDGIGYSHYWYNPMNGRPYSSMVENRLKTIGHSFTMGHQQALQYGVRFVAGKSQHGLVAGCCYLHEEEYQGPQGNHYWSGIIVCHEVEEGSYSPMFVSLSYLCRRYTGKTLRRFLA